MPKARVFVIGAIILAIALLGITSTTGLFQGFGTQTIELPCSSESQCREFIQNGINQGELSPEIADYTDSISCTEDVCTMEVPIREPGD